MKPLDRRESTWGAKGPELLIIPSVGCRSMATEVELDKKFVEGMALYCHLWKGPVRCLMRALPHAVSNYSAHYQQDLLPFRLDVITENEEICGYHLLGSAVVLASGDDHTHLKVAQYCQGLDIPCVYGVEYALETRLRILLAEQGLTWSMLKSLIWTLGTEHKRRRAFGQARSLQANGMPAFRAYGGLARQTLRYFDSRISEDLLADEGDLARAAASRRGTAPLRLLYTGRFDRMKGVHHIVPVMLGLKRLGIAAELDTFGSGPLIEEMRSAVLKAGLERTVHVYEPLDFSTELIPRIKGSYDAFLCCHVQSDPSCTYLETLGCGIPIVGYRNRAFAGILSVADVGWGVPVGKPGALAHAIRRINAHRAEIDHKAAAGLAFARRHLFGRVFAERIDHLRQISGLMPASECP